MGSIWDKYNKGTVESREKQNWERREASTTVTYGEPGTPGLYTTGNGRLLNETRDGMQFKDGYIVSNEAAAKPAWIDGTSTPGLAQQNRRAPIVPIGSAILVKEDEASLDSKRPLGGGVGSVRSVIDRTTGRLRTAEEEENRLRGAVLLR